MKNGLVPGYIDGSGKILIYRYLTSTSGTEFENWFDPDRQTSRSLHEGAWQIRWFVRVAPPRGVLGEAILAVAPHGLPTVNLAQESGARRNHYDKCTVDAIPIKVGGALGWTAQFVIKDKDGRALGPIGIHTHYENSEPAVEMALSHAQTTIYAGVTLPEIRP